MVWRSDLILNGLEARKKFACETKGFSGCPAGRSISYNRVLLYSIS
jgi:hypothetical protein